MTFLEICVDSVESAVAAEAGGAQRVELCAALSEGGLTPSLGMVHAVRSRVRIGIHVMIRPRGGNFVYSEDELCVMRDDIALARKCGADGVVLGLLTTESEIDVERTRELITLARPMEVTFHRAIDMSSDVLSAFEDVIQTGADRVLTSGGEQNANLGRQKIREMVESSRGRIRVMAGGGIRVENLAPIVQATGVTEIHSALRCTPSNLLRKHGISLVAPNVDDYPRFVVHADDVRELQQAIMAAHAQAVQAT